MPITKIPVEHIGRIENIVREYWQWIDDHWEIRADWWDLNNTCWITCRHCETDHNLKILQKAAYNYGFMENPN